MEPQRAPFQRRPKPKAKGSASAALASVFVAVVVLGLKLVAYVLTDSVALYSDALESIVNVVAALLAFLLLRVAAAPPDAEHPYGHGKAEYFSAVVEGVLIVLAAIGIVREAWARFHHPEPIQRAVLGLAVSAVASAINAVLAMYLLRAGKRLRSPALRADGMHVLTDVATSAGVIVGTALAAVTGVLILDPILAGAVTVLIVVTGSKLVRDSIGGLMDTAVSAETLVTIQKVIEGVLSPEMKMTVLKTRRAGARTFIDIHLHVPGAMTVTEAHDVCDRIEDALARAVEGTEVLIHVEPA